MRALPRDLVARSVYDTFRATRPMSVVRVHKPETSAPPAMPKATQLQELTR